MTETRYDIENSSLILDVSWTFEETPQLRNVTLREKNQQRGTMIPPEAIHSLISVLQQVRKDSAIQKMIRTRKQKKQ